MFFLTTSLISSSSQLLKIHKLLSDICQIIPFSHIPDNHFSEIYIIITITQLDLNQVNTKHLHKTIARIDF